MPGRKFLIILTVSILSAATALAQIPGQGQPATLATNLESKEVALDATATPINQIPPATQAPHFESPAGALDATATPINQIPPATLSTNLESMEMAPEATTSPINQIPPATQNPLEGLVRPAEAPFEGTYEEGFKNITALMEHYDGTGNVSLMKLGRVAMTMGRTVGNAGSAWTRKVAKAFKKVDVVYMLDYGDSRPELKDAIEEGVLKYIKKEYLVKRDGEGNFAFDETYGVTSEDGKHVSDLIIILYGQSVVALEGSVLATDVDRIVRRLNKQL